ncbi:hypothetical protein F5877DRAFT_82582 [Lentinula edodes]|nr:hypothetical protein F5877DRAFT_82582 [Lentinula edodes]
MWELSRCNISLKKLRCIAKECCPFKCAAYVAAIGQYTPDQFGFIDETSKDDRTPGQRQGRAKKGQRASTKQPFVRRKRLTVTGLLTQDGMMASRVVEGSMTHEMFCSYLEEEVLSDSSRAFKSWGVASRGLEGGHIDELSFQPYVIILTNICFPEGDHSFYKALINGLATKTTSVPHIAEGEEYECDVLITGELKKTTPETVDDVESLSNATHIMGADPTRRFMFGLTIDKFNDAKNLIYFTLSFSGACREELGYDPTARRVRNWSTLSSPSTASNTLQRKLSPSITVRKAKFLLECATRIFKAQQVLNNEGDLDSEVKVIKDYWLPENSCTELEIRLAIEANIRKVETCEKVPVPSTTEKGQTPDSTSNFLRGQTIPSDVKRFTVSIQSSTYQWVMSVSIPASIMMESGPERQRRQETVLREATAVHLATRP